MPWLSAACYESDINHYVTSTTADGHAKTLTHPHPDTPPPRHKTPKHSPNQVNTNLCSLALAPVNTKPRQQVVMNVTYETIFLFCNQAIPAIADNVICYCRQSYHFEKLAPSALFPHQTFQTPNPNARRVNHQALHTTGFAYNRQFVHNRHSEDTQIKHPPSQTFIFIHLPSQEDKPNIL